MFFCTDEMPTEEIMEIQDWLKSNRGPPSKIFEKLNQTWMTRKKYFQSGVSFGDFITAWPRMFDVDGAVFF
jgi:hypothetical protein